MPPLPENNTQISWATKHSTGIGLILVVLAFICIGLGFYSIRDKSQQNVPPAPIAATPVIAPNPPLHTKHTTSPPLQSASISTAIKGTPQIKEVPFASSSRANLRVNGPDWSLDNRQVLIGMSVVKIRTINGMTAISFKLDGSENTRADIMLNCNSDPNAEVNIIDDRGRRHSFISKTTTFPERLQCNSGGVYTLAPHEIAYETLLFDRLDESIASFDINFKSSNHEPFSIHVVM